MNDIFLSPYSPSEHEKAIYAKWENSGYFNPDYLPKSATEPFCIIMPPPNANGVLHAGHALFVTLQDIIIRYQRMSGKKTLWLPGLDHAGFETQTVFEKKLEKEGRSRFKMSREDFYNEVFDFTQLHKKDVENQLRLMGASCDWSRELFTLDPKVIKQVYSTFEQLYYDGLVYRDLNTVNWCPKHQTTLSDLEVDFEEREEPFYYFQYGPFVIGTSRPETKFGDKYVVVHPDDKRYAEYKTGDTFEAEWVNGKIIGTVIKDEAGDPELGSGAMTITPYHSAIDWDIAKRHKLDSEQIIDERGKILKIGGEFEGMNIKEAREKIVKKLEEKGLVVKIDEKYKHSVPVCYKCNREIEPQLKRQWFIKMKPLASKAIKAIEEEEVKFVTDRFKKISIDWLNNIRDWNISRQIFWGIPIPAKLCVDCDEAVVDIEDKVKVCDKCGGAVRKDEDTFDTWFSSSQWPHITLDHPDKDFQTFYPTSVMETAADILFFWVLRMIMMGLYKTNEVPFKEVYLHGLVLDSKGKKMSKSKGNVTNPIEFSEKYGTDALRFALVVGNAPSNSINLSEDSIRGYKKFSNKIWNIARFVLSEIDGNKADSLTSEDEKIIGEFEAYMKEVKLDMDNNRYHIASEKIYHYLWHIFADKVIEESKEVLKGDNAASRKYVLIYIFANSLKLLHPFMPFITESIWQHIPKGSWKTQDLLMIEKYPI